MLINGIDLNNLDFSSASGWANIIELVKLVVIVPVFLFWSLYDLLTKTVRVKWQRTLIAFGILYNVAYLFIDKNQVNDNITGFLVCYLITYGYRLIKRLFGGDFGMGDVMYCAIVGLLFGTATGVLTIILSFVIFDGLLTLVRKLFPNLGGFAVAYFPYITAGLFITIFLVGEPRVRNAYNYVFGLVNIPRYLKIF